VPKRRATPAACAAALLALSGCGSHPDPRAGVAAYLTAVNKVEVALAAPLASVTRAGPQVGAAAASGGSLTPLLRASQERTLVQALKQLDASRNQLAVIPAPAPARTLRSMLLQLVDDQRALTREVAGLIAYLPSFTHALGSLGPASKRLQVAMAQRQGLGYGAAGVAAAYAGKATALRQFQGVVDATLAKLTKLHPPPVSEPGYAAQVRSLRQMGTSAGQLASAFSAGATTRVAPLLQSFDQALGLPQSAPVQRAEIAAARSYNARLTGLTALARQIALERLRIAKAVP
jgi:hypothetical protein